MCKRKALSWLLAPYTNAFTHRASCGCLNSRQEEKVSQEEGKGQVEVNEMVNCTEESLAAKRYMIYSHSAK